MRLKLFRIMYILLLSILGLSADSYFGELRDFRSSLCMKVEGGNPDNAKVTLGSCDGSDETLWKYNEYQRFIVSKKRDGSGANYCLTLDDQQNFATRLKKCNTNVWLQRWVLNSRHNNDISFENSQSFVLDAYGSTNQSNIGLWSYHGGANQRWSISNISNKALSVDNVIFGMRDGRSSLCVGVDPFSSNTDSEEIKLKECDYNDKTVLWTYDSKERQFRSYFNSDYCITITGVNDYVYLKKCQANDGLQIWNLGDKNIFSAINPSMALDAYGDIIYSGVGIWNYHGLSNQQWNIEPQMALINGTLYENRPFSHEDINRYKVHHIGYRVGTWDMGKTYCQDLNFGGHSNWKLATLHDLGNIMSPSIVTNSEGEEYNIRREFIKNIPPKNQPFGDVYFWSSQAKTDNDAWLADFGGAYYTIYDKNYVSYFMCVANDN